MEDFFERFMIIVVIILIIFGISACCADHQVETYTVGCEVTGIYYTGKHHNDAKLRVRCDEFSAVLDISNTQAAKYVEGDIVVVEVEVRDGWGGEYQQYTLIG